MDVTLAQRALSKMWRSAIRPGHRDETGNVVARTMTRNEPGPNDHAAHACCTEHVLLRLYARRHGRGEARDQHRGNLDAGGHDHAFGQRESDVFSENVFASFPSAKGAYDRRTARE